MKFAFGAKPKAPIRAFQNLIRLGESLGYEAAWVPDQTFFPDPFVSIAVCATVTKRIELVIGVANPYTRHPVQVARAAATLDDVAPGRIVLGYGAGNRKELIVPLGEEQDRPAWRCREAIDVCRRLLRGETLHYRSDTLVADPIELEMPAHPDIPIYLAGRGPRVLQVAGEVADVAVIGALLSPAGLKFSVDQVRAGAERAGRSLNNVGLMLWITCYVTDEPSIWIDQYRPSAAHILAGAPVEVFTALGLTPAYRDELKNAYLANGSAMAARLVPDELVLQLAAIGTPEHIIDQLQPAVEAGIDQIGILVNAATIEQSEQMLQRFAESVMPAIA